jgi:hypothetical protein
MQNPHEFMREAIHGAYGVPADASARRAGENVTDLGASFYKFRKWVLTTAPGAVQHVKQIQRSLSAFLMSAFNREFDGVVRLE